MKKIIANLLLLLLIISSLFLSSCQEDFCLHSDMSKESFLPTCTEQGYTVYSCTSCSYKVSSDFVDATGHKLSKSTVEPTCSSSGYTLFKCDLCGYSYKQDFSAPTEHAVVSAVISPTCTSQGYTIYSCRSCSFLYHADFISANTHAFKKTVVAPTCTDAGYTLLTCSDCGEEISTDYTTPTGHIYTDTLLPTTSSSDGYTLHECTECDYSYCSDYIYSHAVFMGARVKGTTPLARGIDVSMWNDSINWSTVKNQGFDFAIIRAGSSISGVDSMFEYNYQSAKSAGLDVGAYFYIEARTVDEVLEHARALMPLLEGKQFEYPIYYDFEDPALTALGKDLLTEMCVAFVEELQRNGYFGAIYTNEDWLLNNFNADTVTSLFDIWYARYTTADTPEWNTEKFGANMGLWQYTQAGKIEGHSADFCFDIAYRDYPSIIKRYHYNGY